MKMKGFYLSLVCHDDGDGIVGFEAVASNHRFAGEATWWGYVNDLESLSNKLAGFPRVHGDAVNLDFAENCCLRLECIDSCGHITVTARLGAINPAVSVDESGQSVLLKFNTVPASIDCFVSNLKAFANRQVVEAVLEATH